MMDTLQAAIDVVSILQKAHHTALFAGGWVRDLLMKHPSDDIDIATSALAHEVQALFPKTIPVGIAFGIVIVVHQGHQFEVATFRKESGYLDGRRPTRIESATPEEDAKRRDFTINGLFYDPLQEQLYDYVDGAEDIQRGIVRAIGNAHERFLEDRLRMMRAVRYATRFEFPIEEKTTDAILAHAKSLLPAVAIERVWQEFKKMSQFAHFDRGLISLHKLGLLSTIFPSLENVSLSEVEQRLFVLRRFPKEAPTIAELVELFPSDSLEQLLALCDFLKLSREDRDFVQFLHHAKQLLFMPKSWEEKLEKAEWARFYAHPHAQICLEIVATHHGEGKKEVFLQEHKERRAHLKGAIQRIQEKNPVVCAADLLKKGVSPSPKMGKLLAEAERISINQNLEDKEAIIAQLDLDQM